MGVKVKKIAKPVMINPLKFSQSMGASLAFLGIDRCVPIIHGCQGCTAFIKALFVKHFREPAFVHTTALTEIEAIMDGTEGIKKSLSKLFGKLNPEIIGILTTGLTEVKGDDIEATVKECAEVIKIDTDSHTVLVSTPDYAGCMQQGFSEATSSIINQLGQLELGPADKRENQINIIVPSFLTPADIWILKETVNMFGLIPVVLPDISGSLDGQLNAQPVFIARGGTSLKEIKSIKGSVATISIGESMEKPASLLKRSTPVYNFSSIYGLNSFDQFLKLLSEISGKAVPDKFRRERKQLLDAMLDTHFYISQKRFALAMEPDLMVNLAEIILELGGVIAKAVAPATSISFESLLADYKKVGDFYDLEAIDVEVDMLLASSHGVYSAEAMGVPLFRVGFPVMDRLGINQRAIVGYKGMMEFLFELGNMFTPCR